MQHTAYTNLQVDVMKLLLLIHITFVLMRAVIDLLLIFQFVHICSFKVSYSYPGIWCCLHFALTTGVNTLLLDLLSTSSLSRRMSVLQIGQQFTVRL